MAFGRDPSLSRRAFLAALAAGAASPALPAAAGAPVALKEAAAGRGLFFGAAVMAGTLQRDADFRAAVLTQCSCLTPELSMKWAAAEPARGRLDLAGMDGIADFARRHGLLVHGHALLWHDSIPPWAAAALRDAPDWQLVRNHIATVMPRYGDVVRHWDVVNEPVEPGERTDGLRVSPFLRAFGEDYIARALREARLFAPAGRLMINQFGLEYDIPVERARRDALLRLIERLKRRDVPLDGIGLQAHLDLRKGPVATASIAAFLREIEAFGLEVIVTELDVKEADYVASAEQRDIAVADETRRYVEAVLPSPALRGVISWGLSDRYSWLQVTEDELAAYQGAWQDGDGPGVNRGLPLDAMLAPKRMHAALASAFAA